MKDEDKYNEIRADIDEWLNDDDKLKTMKKVEMETMIEKWMADF